MRSAESHGSTVSSACSSLTPDSKAIVAAEAGRDLQRLAPVLAEAGERLEQELLVGDRLADLERRVPGGEHRQVVVVEVLDGLGVVDLELVLGDLVDPGANHLAEQLPPRLAADRLGDDADRFLWLDEAEGHVRCGLPGGWGLRDYLKVVGG